MNINDLKLRLDETRVRKMDLIDGPLVKTHISIVATLYRDQEARLDNVWFGKVFELDVLVLQVEVGKLTLAGRILSLAARRAM